MRVGSTEWERAGGPGLTFGQQLAFLGGAVGLISSHFLGALGWKLRKRTPPKIDLSAWNPPDSAIVVEARRFLEATSSQAMAGHCHRTFWFTAVQLELARARERIDLEALYVGALLHDVGFFLPPVEGEHCFSVASAREARRIATSAGWDDARQNVMALTITSNLNPSVPESEFGAESHFIAQGGRVEVLAQDWRVHPENLSEILSKHPRSGYHAEAYEHVSTEARRHPRCRFACLNPMFGWLVKHSYFDSVGEEVQVRQ